MAMNMTDMCGRLSAMEAILQSLVIAEAKRGTDLGQLQATTQHAFAAQGPNPWNINPPGDSELRGFGQAFLDKFWRETHAAART